MPRRPLPSLALATLLAAGCTTVEWAPPATDGEAGTAATGAAVGAATDGGLAPVAANVDDAWPWAAPPATLDIHFRQPPLPAGAEGDRVRRGRAILLATRDSLPDHVGNALRCTSCHLDEGRRPFAGPWTGVADRYPQYRSRAGRAVSLAERVNGCLQRSMNGTALDTAGDAMAAILAYFRWRSTGIGDGRAVPAIGLLPFASLAPGSDGAGDPEAGADVYVASCARCHGGDGAGTPLAPPVWGPQSYNEGAGMARESKAAGFIRANMPYDMPGTLTDRQARDVAAYLAAQPRPRFAGKARDWPKGDAPPDATYLARP